MDMDMDEPRNGRRVVQYDLDEEVVEEEDEVVEEATKLSDNVAEPKGGDADNNESPLTKKPAGTKVEGAGEPVAVKDGGEGAKGEGAKDPHPWTTLNVESKRLN